MTLARPLAAFLSVAVPALSAGCVRIDPSGRVQSSAKHEAARGAELGYPARIFWTGAEPDPRRVASALQACGEAVNCLMLGGDGLKIRPRVEDRSALSSEAIADIAHTGAQPFLRVRDYEGAMRGTARSYLNWVERTSGRRLVPVPAPIFGPNAGRALPNVDNTARSGIPAAALLACCGLALRAHAKRRSTRWSER